MNRLDVSALQKLWQQRSVRERRLLGWGTSFILASALWQWALAPAWHTWQQAPEHQAKINSTTQRMQQLQVQALQLKDTTVVLDRISSMAWVKSHLNELGENTKLTESGAMVRLEIQAANADGLAQWLTQAREEALVWPETVSIERETSPAGTIQWKGTLTLRMP